MRIEARSHACIAALLIPSHGALHAALKMLELGTHGARAGHEPATLEGDSSSRTTGRARGSCGVLEPTRASMHPGVVHRCVVVRV